jgi:hypothetical protein
LLQFVIAKTFIVAKHYGARRGILIASSPQKFRRACALFKQNRNTRGVDFCQIHKAR